MISQTELQQILHYDPDTGVFTWLVNRGIKQTKGQRAGNIESSGHRQITIDGKRYQANRLAVLYMTGQWPEDDVDHKDLDCQNDKWSNLREATHQQNCRNRKKGKNNTSGYKGVFVEKKRNRIRAMIQHDGKLISLGRFDSVIAAAKAYNEAAIVYHGPFAQLNQLQET